MGSAVLSRVSLLLLHTQAKSGRGLITVVALLLTFPRLAEAFLPPTGAVSSGASINRSSGDLTASSASSCTTREAESAIASSPTRRPAPIRALSAKTRGVELPDDDGGEGKKYMTPPQDPATTTSRSNAVRRVRPLSGERNASTSAPSAPATGSAECHTETGTKTKSSSRNGGGGAAGLENDDGAPVAASNKSGMMEADPTLVRVGVVGVSDGAEEGQVTRLWNLPNVLTVGRIALIPIFAMFFYASLPRRNVWCAAIFGGAALTDWFDGYIARTRGLETPFGAFLDPVADKLMVSTALILLCERLGPWMTICSAIILCRELAVSALREWMAQLGLRETVKVGNAGKWKTATQMIAVNLLLLLEPGATVTLLDPVVFMPLAKGLLYISTVLTVTSGSSYLRAAWPTLVDPRPRKK